MSPLGRKLPFKIEYRVLAIVVPMLDNAAMVDPE